MVSLGGVVRHPLRLSVFCLPAYAKFAFARCVFVDLIVVPEVQLVVVDLCGLSVFISASPQLLQFVSRGPFVRPRVVDGLAAQIFGVQLVGHVWRQAPKHPLPFVKCLDVWVKTFQPSRQRKHTDLFQGMSGRSNKAPGVLPTGQSMA